MPTLNTTTGGYPAPISVSTEVKAQIENLPNNSSTQLSSTSYPKASRSGDLVTIVEKNGRTYDYVIDKK